jgi:hypothetical protein
MILGSGRRSRAGSRCCPRRSRTTISTAVIAPQPASTAAQPIAVRPSAAMTPCGIPAIATTGLATAQRTATAADRNASSHMTTLNVRSNSGTWPRPVMSPGNQLR